MFDAIRKFFSKKSKTSGSASPKGDTTRRIRLILSQLEPVRNKPLARSVKVRNLSDVLRFMLKICDVRLMDCKMTGGRLRCRVRLPDNGGMLLLTEKELDDRHITVAVLKIDIPLMEPRINEVKFILKKH